MEHNLTEREVYCPQCHKYFLNGEPNPHCIYCKSTLITVVSSIVTGDKLTGMKSISLPMFKTIKEMK